MVAEYRVNRCEASGYLFTLIVAGLMLGNIYIKPQDELCEVQCYRRCLSQTGGVFLERIFDRSVNFADTRPVFKWDVPTARNCRIPTKPLSSN